MHLRYPNIFDWNGDIHPFSGAGDRHAPWPLPLHRRWSSNNGSVARSLKKVPTLWVEFWVMASVGFPNLWVRWVLWSEFCCWLACISIIPWVGVRQCNIKGIKNMQLKYLTCDSDVLQPFSWTNLEMIPVWLHLRTQKLPVKIGENRYLGVGASSRATVLSHPVP